MPSTHNAYPSLSYSNPLVTTRLFSVFLGSQLPIWHFSTPICKKERKKNVVIQIFRTSLFLKKDFFWQSCAHMDVDIKGLGEWLRSLLSASVRMTFQWEALYICKFPFSFHPSFLRLRVAYIEWMIHSIPTTCLREVREAEKLWFPQSHLEQRFKHRPSQSNTLATIQKLLSYCNSQSKNKGNKNNNKRNSN